MFGKRTVATCFSIGEPSVTGNFMNRQTIVLGTRIVRGSCGDCSEANSFKRLRYEFGLVMKWTFQPVLDPCELKLRHN
jgi:hypothetical protein